MTIESDEAERQRELRARAVASLNPPGAPAHGRKDASAALGVLYSLASSPSTAPDALALLHELQVHQVELDLQDEEMRRSRGDLESSLQRQMDLYEFAPVAYLTLDAEAIVRELNGRAALALEVERVFLRGRSLDLWLSSAGATTLRAMLGRIRGDGSVEHADLEMRAERNGLPRMAIAAVSADPAGDGFLLALLGFRDPAGALVP
jgi:hypothetical protein